MSFFFTADGVCVCCGWRVMGKGDPMGIHTVGTEKMQINQALCSDVWDIVVKPQNLNLYSIQFCMYLTLKNLSAVCTLHNLYVKSNDFELQSLKEEPRYHICRGGALTTGSIMLMYLHLVYCLGFI